MTDRGHAAVELALGIGVLLVPAALAVLSFGPWSETRVAAEALAAEAARATVLVLSHAAGEAVVVEQASTLGLDAEMVRVGWCGADPENPAAGVCSFARGSVVSVSVEVWTPLVSTPWGPVGGLWVSADHSEPIDLYRSLG
jgi:hypothetical protein